MKRTLVIGDIHGCYEELLELLEVAGITENDCLISVGDIVDRGAFSKEVFLFLKNRPNTIVLMGNHERKHQNNILTYAQEITRLQMGEEYHSFLEWVKNLPYYWETKEALVVHAAIEPDIPIWGQKEEILCGSTSGERLLEKRYSNGTHWHDHYQGEKPIIYGHHIAGELPLIKNKTYGIDTGACHGSRLTAIEIPSMTLHQIKAKKDYWKEEQKKWQLPVLQSKNWEYMDLDMAKKQIQKLSYVQDEEVITYLKSLENKIHTYEQKIPLLKASIEALANQLMEEDESLFAARANQFFFKTFLFKSKNKQLKEDDLRKALNSLFKINELGIALGIEDFNI